jgi:hypothetical protein
VTEEGRDVGREIKRSLAILTAATVVLYLAVAIVGAVSFHSTRVNTDALCALRGDLKNRVAASQRFLVDHPAGVAGIPAKTIRDGIKNQQRTIAALKNISC